MTNQEIILSNSLNLMNQGIIKGTGNTINIEIDGVSMEVEEPQPIHTFQHWKALGYQVKKGSKAVAQFKIWKHTSRKITDENTDEEEMQSYMFMKLASFFSVEQVEKIA